MKNSQTVTEPLLSKWREWSASDSLTRSTASLILGTIIVIVSLVHLLWIHQNGAPMGMVDVYAYLTNLLRFTDHLQQHGLENFWDALGDLSQGGRPPLYQIFTLPITMFFGRSEGAALTVNLFYIAVLLLSVYHLGLAAKNRQAGLLAAVIVISYPPITQLSRTYSPYFAAACWTPLSIWLLILLLKHRTPARAWAWGASVAIGLLTHPNFAKVLAIPSIVFGIYLVLFQTRPYFPSSVLQGPRWLLDKIKDRVTILGLLPIAILASGLTLSWYLTHGRRLYDKISVFSSMNLDRFRGFDVVTLGFPEAKPSFLWYAQTAPGTLSNVYAALALIAVLYFLAMVMTYRSGPRLARSLLLLTLLASYAIMSSRNALAWYYAVAVLPFAAALTGALVIDIKNKWISNSLTALCVLLALFNFYTMSWGGHEWDRKVAKALGSPLDSVTCKGPTALGFCPSSPKPEKWPVGEVLDAVFEDPQCRKRQPCQLMIIKGGGLTDFLFKYHLARTYPDAKLKISSQLNRVFGKPYPLGALLKSDYIFYWEDPRSLRRRAPRNYFNASQELLQKPPESFRRSHEIARTFEAGGRGVAKLLKRTQPLTAAEAEDTIEALDLDDKYKSKKAVLLAQLRRREGRGDPPSRLAEDPPKPQQAEGSPANRASRSSSSGVGQAPRGQDLARLEQLVQLRPEDENARLRLARAYRAEGQITAAVTTLEAAVTINPRSVRTRLHLADLYSLHLKQTEKAVAILREALEINPNSANAHMSLGLALRKAGQPDAALAEFERASRLAPKQARPRRLLAETYLTLDQKTKAISSYEEILEIKPEDSNATQALSRLRNK